MVATKNLISGKIHVHWLDDSGGVTETCHYNDPSIADRNASFIGKIFFRDGKWFSQLGNTHDVKEHKSYVAARRFVEDSVHGEQVS